MPSAKSNTRTNIVIVLPTQNRPQLLRRSLEFYKRYGFAHKIRVADSSHREFHDDMDNIVEDFPEIDIQITRFPPEISPWLKITEVMQAQPDEYIGLSGDDDFLFSDAIDACVDFLKENPDYSVVDGQEIRVALPSKLLTTNWSFSGLISRQEEISSPTPLKRLVSHFELYWPTFYGIHRRDSVIESFRTAYEMETVHLMSEMMQSAMAVLNGKYRSLELPFIVRQVYHNQSIAFDDWNKIVNSDEFEAQIRFFHDRVQAKQNADPEEVRLVCDVAFAGYLKQMLPNYDYLGSTIALSDKKAAQDYIDTRKISKQIGGADSVQIFSPKDICRLATDQNSALLIASTAAISQNPDGLFNNLSEQLAAQKYLPKLPNLELEYLVRLVCYSGFHSILKTALDYHNKTSSIVTYASLDLIASANHFSCPLLPEIIATANLAILTNSVKDVETLISTHQSRNLDFDLLSKKLPDNNEATPLQKCASLLVQNSSNFSEENLEVFSGFWKTASNDLERAMLFSLFSALCSVLAIPNRVLTTDLGFVEILKNINDSAFELLFEVSRSAFAAHRRNDLSKLDLGGFTLKSNSHSLAFIRWSSEFAAALRDVNNVTQSREIFLKLLTIFPNQSDGSLWTSNFSKVSHRIRKATANKNYSQNPSQTTIGWTPELCAQKAEGHVRFEYALLSKAIDDDMLFNSELEKAVNLLDKSYGSDHWLTQAAQNTKARFLATDGRIRAGLVSK